MEKFLVFVVAMVQWNLAFSNVSIPVPPLPFINGVSSNWSVGDVSWHEAGDGVLELRAQESLPGKVQPHITRKGDVVSVFLGEQEWQVSYLNLSWKYKEETERYLLMDALYVANGYGNIRLLTLGFEAVKLFGRKAGFYRRVICPEIEASLSYIM